MRDDFKQKNGYDLEELRREVSTSPIRTKYSPNRPKFLDNRRATPNKFTRIDRPKNTRSKRMLCRKKSSSKLPKASNCRSSNIPLKKSLYKKPRNKFSISKKRMKKVKRSELRRSNLSDKKVHFSPNLESRKSNLSTPNIRSEDEKTRPILKNSNIAVNIKFDNLQDQYSRDESVEDNFVDEMLKD